jgi:hypothetical protein
MAEIDLEGIYQDTLTAITRVARWLSRDLHRSRLRPPGCMPAHVHIVSWSMLSLEDEPSL